MPDERVPNMNDLVALVARLHEPPPAGCPWCLAQTPESLADDLAKEAHEVIDAVIRGESAALAEELGDVLMLIVAQSRLAEGTGDFTFEDVVARLVQKVQRRHPHIFADAEATTPEDVVRNWQAIKREEQSGRESLLAGIPRSLPALLRASEMQNRAAAVGFDWPDVSGALAKVHEEIDELAAAAETEQAEEFGDVLMSLVSLARQYGLSAEAALLRACEKFARRFTTLEQACRARGVRPEDLTLLELDALWNLAKVQP